MDEEFYREKDFYTKIAIGVFYGLLIGLCVFLIMTPREVEIIDGQVKVSAPISPEFIIIGGLIFIFAILLFSIIALNNAKQVYKEWNHTKLIKGTIQQGMKKGEPLKIFVEKIIPFNRLPPEEKKDTLIFLKDNLKTLKETSNIELIESLLSKVKKSKSRILKKKLEKTKGDKKKQEEFKDKIEKATEEIDNEIKAITNLNDQVEEKKAVKEKEKLALTPEEESILELDGEFLALFDKYRDMEFKKLKKLFNKKDKKFIKFTRLVARKLSNMFSWSSLVGSIDGDGGYEVDGYLVDLFENDLYKALIRNRVIERSISYLKSDFRPDVIQVLNEIDFDNISISLIIAKREMTFLNYPKLPFTSIIMISREDINESLHYIIGDEDEIYGYEIPFDTAYVHTALFGFSKFDRPVICLLHAYGKDEGLFQSIAEANKISTVMKDVMLATINDLEAKKKVHDTKIDASNRYAMELEEMVELTMKDTKAIRTEYVQEELNRMRVKESGDYEEYTTSPLWVKILLFLIIVGIVVVFGLVIITEGDLSKLFKPPEEISPAGLSINFIRGILCR